jgi:hypothetical protein
VARDRLGRSASTDSPAQALAPNGPGVCARARGRRRRRRPPRCGGGDVVDFGKVIEAIEGAQADIVGLQEAEGNTRRIAGALGWPYWSDRLHVVSRLPLIDPPGAKGEYVLVQVRPGAVFALANVHLTSDPYGPCAVRDGKSLRQILRLERRTRLPEIGRRSHGSRRCCGAASRH